MLRYRWLALAAAGSCTVPASAAAHAFGARYDLPLPLWLYLAGAGTVVALSFVVMAFFMHDPARPSSYPRLKLLGLTRILVRSRAVRLLRTLSVAAFVLILAAGFFGAQDPFANIAPILVWVIWWVGLAYVSALLGNLWALINPWEITFSWAEALYRRSHRDGRLSFCLPCPAWLGAWPAVVLFLVFAWIELIYDEAEVPARLALLILAYSLLTWTGMVAFGKREWLGRGEVFSLVFGLLARFAPLQGKRADPARGRPGYVCLRPYAVGLLTDHPVHPSIMMLVLLMLSTVTFDGFIETPAWAGILDWIVADRTLRPLLLELRAMGFDLLVVVQTAALVVFPALFLAVYLAFGQMMASLGGPAVSVGAVARSFVLTLIPIAIAYHLAHYLSYLLLAGQLIIPLASDPFGFGWNLFGTANYRMDISIVDARLVWYVAVVAIVLGHVAAVYLAHVMALRMYREPRNALRSQYPMLILMVGYTMISLWILSQPIVET